MFLSINNYGNGVIIVVGANIDYCLMIFGDSLCN